MSQPTPMLHLVCGKIASGKSTLSSKLAEDEGTVRISEDEWLSALFSDQMASGSDYLRFSTKLQAVMGSHVCSLLQAGVSVVLDFAANTLTQRLWMRQIIDSTGVDHQLHLLDVPDKVCLARLRERNAAGEHESAATERQFHTFSNHFMAPTPDEGFNVVKHPF